MASMLIMEVLEHGTFITGPAASMLLADLGADVVKVELPGTGDPFRAFQGRALFAALPDGQPQQAQRHAQHQAGRRPGEVRRAGQGRRRLHPELPSRVRRADQHRASTPARHQPKLIYCAISGFGATGPAAAPAHLRQVAQAASGFLGCW
jgi:crotonobetainyl-CoA:carnitine CoA-transferase CaiB-like acyl-CoA transferase